MPQEFHVIRCYSCETFQVHIVKKLNKWDCKMCGEKQSIKKVYFQGSGKDCRLNVQKLNEKRILNELKTKTPENSEINEFENQIDEVNLNSKWEEFLPTKQESSEDEDEVEQSMYTLNRPNKRKSFNKRTNDNKNKKIKIKSEKLPNKQDQDHFQIENEGTSKWKNFISNMKSNSQNALKEASNKSNLLLVNDEMKKKSKWDCFVDNENEDDNEINISLNRDTKQSSSNIFSSDNNNLDDILTL